MVLHRRWLLVLLPLLFCGHGSIAHASFTQKRPGPGGDPDTPRFRFISPPDSGPAYRVELRDDPTPPMTRGKDEGTRPPEPGGTLIDSGPLAGERIPPLRGIEDTGEVTASSRADQSSALILHNARNVQWDPLLRALSASGEVRASSGSYRIAADTVTYYRQLDTVVARGNVRVDAPGQLDRIRGDYFRLDRTTNEIFTRRTRGHYFPWYFRARRVEGDADTAVHIQGASFSTVSREDPPWDFKADEYYLYPNDKLVGYHVTLEVADMPVFYLPYMSVNLKENVSRWEIRPGYSSEDGAMLDLNYHYLMKRDGYPVTGTLYTDSRQKAGIGYGFDVEYNQPQRHLYLFYFQADRPPLIINDAGEEVRSDTEELLWKLRSDANYRFGDSDWKLHGNVDWVSRNRVNKDFQRRLANRTVSDRSYQASLIRRGESSLFRIDANREDRVTNQGGGNEFERSTGVLPRVQYQLYSQPVPFLGRGVYYRTSNTAERLFQADSDERLWDFQSRHSLIKSFPWTRRFGQSMRVGYDQQVEEQSNSEGGDFEPFGVGEFVLRNSLQAAPRLTFDLSYSLEQRFNRTDSAPLTLNGQNLGFEDRGLERHDVGFTARWRADRTFVFFRTGYDLRQSATTSIESDSRVLSPRLTLNTRLTPYWSWDQFLRWDWANQELQQVNTGWSFDLTRNLRTDLDWNFNRAPGQDFSQLEHGLNWDIPYGKWRFRSDLVYNLKSEQLDETHLMVYRELYDWELRLFYQEILDRDRQLWLTLNLKFYPQKSLGFEPELGSGGVGFEQGGWREIGG